jgi:hypothetical protein
MALIAYREKRLDGGADAAIERRCDVCQDSRVA